MYQKLAGVKVRENKFESVRRFWKMTYLDKDFRVMYASKNMAVEDGYIFVLERDHQQQQQQQ